MPTKLELDDDLFLELQRIAAESGVALSTAVNRASRAELASHRPERRPFRQRTLDVGRASVDLARANEVAAALDDPRCPPRGR